MNFIDRLKRSRQAARLVERAESLLADAERLDAAGSPNRAPDGPAQAAFDHLREAESCGYGDADHLNLRTAQALLLLGRAAQALPHAYDAASARPYDVDSRVVHGKIRLALDQLDEALHEYEAVLEEFAGDADALAGVRAVSLARGDIPITDAATHDERTDDLQSAALLLVSAWDAAGVVEARIAALRGGIVNVELIDVLTAAASRRPDSDALAEAT